MKKLPLIKKRRETNNEPPKKKFIIHKPIKKEHQHPKDNPWTPIETEKERHVYYPGKTFQGKRKIVPEIDIPELKSNLGCTTHGINSNNILIQNIDMIDFTSLEKVKETGIYLLTTFIPFPEYIPNIISIIEFEDTYLEIYENNQSFYLQIMDVWNHTEFFPTKKEIEIIKEGLLELEAWVSMIRVSGEEKKETTYPNGMKISNFCDLDCLAFLLKQ
jgi:hypothetical protein